MAPRYITPASADGTVRVLQLTDCHLFADESKDLLGVNTSESFKAVVEAVRAQNFDYDLLPLQAIFRRIIQLPRISILLISFQYFINPCFSYQEIMMMVH